MSDLFARRLRAEIQAKEGGYSNHPSDPGGETMHGVTRAVARQYGYMGEMKSMPWSEAERIYRRRYYEEPHFDKLAELSEDIAAECFDTGVNMAPTWAVIFLQRCLNGFAKQGVDYPLVVEDGDLGAATLSAAKAFLAHRSANGERVMVKALNVLQGARYFELAQANPRLSAFLYGWIANRVSL